MESDQVILVCKPASSVWWLAYNNSLPPSLPAKNRGEVLLQYAFYLSVYLQLCDAVTKKFLGNYYDELVAQKGQNESYK